MGRADRAVKDNEGLNSVGLELARRPQSRENVNAPFIVDS